MRNQTHYVISATSWTIVGKAISFVITLATTIVFAHFASQTTVGEYSYLLSLTTIAGIFTLTGTNSSLVRSVARGSEGSVRMIARARIKWGLIGSLIILAIAFWYLIHNNTHLGFLLIIIAFFIPFLDTLKEVVLNFWQGKRNFRVRALYEISYQLIIALIIIPSIVLINTPFTTLFVYFSAPVVAGIIIFIYTQKYIGNHITDPHSLRFGKHLTLLDALQTTASYLDKIILWQFTTPALLAVYTLAQLPVSKIEQLIPIDIISLPSLSTGDITPERKRFVLEKFGLLFLFSISSALVLYFLAPLIYSLVFPNYLSSVPIFQMLVIFVVSLAPVVLLKTALIGNARTKELTIIQVVTSVARIVTLCISVPLWGIWGAVYAIIISEIVEAVVTLILFLKIK